MSDMTRDDWASIPLALNSLAAAIMAPYPTSGTGQYVQQQYDIAQQNMVTAKQEEAARQAAKKAHRASNRTLAIAGAGALVGGAAGLAGAPFGAVQGASLGASVGQGLNTGNYSGVVDAFSGMIPKAPKLRSDYWDDELMRSEGY